MYLEIFLGDFAFFGEFRGISRKYQNFAGPRPREISEALYRGYYIVARRYEFYFRMAKQYFTNERSEWVKYCFCHEKIKFTSSSRHVMFFLLYTQKDIDKIIDFYLPKSHFDHSNLQYNNYKTLLTIILRINTELNRVLQWQNISKALKNV